MKHLRRALGLNRDEPLLTMEQLAEKRGFPNGHSARLWVKRHQVPYLHRGRRVMVRLADFDRVMVTEEAKRIA